MAKTRVVVVDDSALVRSLLGEIINRQAGQVETLDVLLVREGVPRGRFEPFLDVGRPDHYRYMSGAG
mgnify:CR=1 FL=1